MKVIQIQKARELRHTNIEQHGWTTRYLESVRELNDLSIAEKYIVWLARSHRQNTWHIKQNGGFMDDAYQRVMPRGFLFHKTIRNVTSLIWIDLILMINDDDMIKKNV